MQGQPAPLPGIPLQPLTSRRICSSLALQQLLYYHSFYSAAWLVAHGTRIGARFRVGLALQDPDVVRSVLTALWALAEPARLAAGYYGNLQENVPWLVMFVALTLAPQTAVCYYMMLAQWYLEPFDKALSVATAILLHCELFAGVYAIARMLRLQRAQYYLFEAAVQRQAARKQWARRQARDVALLGGGGSFGGLG